MDIHLFMILYLLISQGTVIITSKCPQSCTCSSTISNCQSQFLNQIPSGFDEATTHLYLDQNFITTVKRHDLDSLPNLQVLSIAMNEIHSIEDESFSALHALEKLFLNRNQIHSLTASTLKGLQSLNLLQLDDQRSSNLCIEDRVFEDLSALNELSLRSANLIHITNHTFDGLHNLRVLSLTGDNDIKLLAAGSLTVFHLPNTQIFLNSGHILSDGNSRLCCCQSKNALKNFGLPVTLNCVKDGFVHSLRDAPTCVSKGHCRSNSQTTCSLDDIAIPDIVENSSSIISLLSNSIKFQQQNTTSKMDTSSTAMASLQSLSVYNVTENTQASLLPSTSNLFSQTDTTTTIYSSSLTVMSSLERQSFNELTKNSLNNPLQTISIMDDHSSFDSILSTTSSIIVDNSLVESILPTTSSKVVDSSLESFLPTTSSKVADSSLESILPTTSSKVVDSSLDSLLSSTSSKAIDNIVIRSSFDGVLPTLTSNIFSQVRSKKARTYSTVLMESPQSNNNDISESALLDNVLLSTFSPIDAASIKLSKSPQIQDDIVDNILTTTIEFISSTSPSAITLSQHYKNALETSDISKVTDMRKSMLFLDTKSSFNQDHSSSATERISFSIVSHSDIKTPLIISTTSIKEEQVTPQLFQTSSSDLKTKSPIPDRPTQFVSKHTNSSLTETLHISKATAPTLKTKFIGIDDDIPLSHFQKNHIKTSVSLLLFTSVSTEVSIEIEDKTEISLLSKKRVISLSPSPSLSFSLSSSLTPSSSSLNQLGTLQLPSLSPSLSSQLLSLSSSLSPPMSLFTTSPYPSPSPSLSLPISSFSSLFQSPSQSRLPSVSSLQPLTSSTSPSLLKSPIIPSPTTTSSSFPKSDSNKGKIIQKIQEVGKSSSNEVVDNDDSENILIISFTLVFLAVVFGAMYLIYQKKFGASGSFDL